MGIDRHHTHDREVSRHDVAVVVPSMRSGGAERVAVNVANGLAGRDHRVALVALSRGDTLRGDVASTVDVTMLDAPRVAAAVPRLARWIRENRPPRLLSHVIHANLVTLAASRLARPPRPRVVVVEHNMPGRLASMSAKRRDRLMVSAIPYAYRHADAVVAVSDGVATALRAAGVSAPLVVPNAVLDDHFSVRDVPALDDPWLRDGGPSPIVAASRLVPEKDHATLLAAVALLRRQGTPARLIVLGDGPLRGVLEELAAELDIRDCVRFEGYVHDPLPWLRAAGAVVLTSRVEGAGNVLVEALACGAPVVATDCPSGPAEILDHGRYGELVPVGDVAALATALARAVSGERRVVPDDAWRRYTITAAVPRWEGVLGL